MTNEAPGKKDGWLTPREHHGKTHEYRRRSTWELAREEALTDWVGEEAELEMETRHAPARHIGEVMGEVIKGFNEGERAILRRIVDHWEELVGTEIAGVTSPQQIRRGTLLIEVADASWRFRLQAILRDLKDAVEQFTRGEVTGIRLVPTGRSPTR